MTVSSKIFWLFGKKMSREGGSFESFSLLLSSLLDKLEVLDWDANKKGKKKTKGEKAFTVPYKTLLYEAGRADLAAAKQPDKGKVVQILRKSKSLLEQKIAKELDGDPFSLIPVLQFFGSSQKGTKRERPDPIIKTPALPNTSREAPRPHSRFTLFAVPGAKKSLRMSIPFDKGPDMASWIYEYMMTISPVLSSDTVGLWLAQRLSKVSPKLLRLQEAVSCRTSGRLLILDFNAFTAKYLREFGEIKDYAKLATLIALRWSDLKARAPWVDLPNKQMVLADLVDPTLRFTKADLLLTETLDESYTIVTSAMISAILSLQADAITLAIAKKALGLRCTKIPPFAPPTAVLQTPIDVAQYFGFGLAKGDVRVTAAGAADLYLDIVPSADKRAVCLLLHSAAAAQSWSCLFSGTMLKQVPSMLKSDELPSDIHASRVFAKTGRVPHGLQFDKEGIMLTSYVGVKLCFAWYMQKNGLIDLEQLFQDAYQLLRDGLPRSMSAESAEHTFADLVKSLGLLGALQKLTDVAARHHSYPHSVVPVFDMRFISPATQSYAYEIHRLTGRFSEHVAGYYNSALGARVLLQDVCNKKRQIRDEVLQAQPWLTASMRRHFSPKELCLLMVSVFADAGANSPMQLHFDALKIRLGKTDTDALKRLAPLVTLQQLRDHASSKLVGVTAAHIDQMTNHYLRMIMETEGPFLVYRQAQIDEVLSRAVLAEQTPLVFSGSLAFLDLPLGLANFNAWINQQARNREQLMPNVPCEVRIRKTGEIATLVVFKYDKDRWYVWNNETGMAEYARRDFDIIEENRCLPAPVHIFETNASGIALKRSQQGSTAYWVRQSSDSPEVKMVLGKHFAWSSDVYFDPKMLQHQVAAAERSPELVDQLFDQDSAFVYQAEELLLPGKECNDWAMREFFAKKSLQSIWPFVRFFQLQVTTEILYHAFFMGNDFESEKSWAARAKLHVAKACEWFWQKMLSSDIGYDRMVWQTKLKGRNDCPDTYAYVMNLLYGTTK